MTNQKLTKYLEKFESKITLSPSTQQTKIPRVISDSKGRYLKEQVQLPAENQIKWSHNSQRRQVATTEPGPYCGTMQQYAYLHLIRHM